MAQISIYCDTSAALEGEFVLEFYDSLNLAPQDCLQKQILETDLIKSAKLFGLVTPIPEELRTQSEWICLLREENGALLLYINDFAWAAEVHTPEGSNCGTEALPPSLRALSLVNCAPDDLAALQALPSLESLKLIGRKTLTDVGPLAALKRLTNLTLRSCKGLSDIRAISCLTNLSGLELLNCNEVADLSPLACIGSLQSLRLSRCDSVADLGPLSSLRCLQALELNESSSISDLGPLASLGSLQSLKLSRCDDVADLGPLASLTDLMHLEVSFCFSLSNLQPLSSLRKLQSLSLENCPSITDLKPLSSLAGLIDLNLSACSAIVALDPLSSLERLDELNLSGCRSVTDSRPLSLLRNLRRLNIGFCSIADLGPLSSLINLESLCLSSCWSVGNLEPISFLHRLVNLDASHCGEIKDLGPLSSLTQLVELNLLCCGLITDLAPVAFMANLESLNLDGSSKIFDLSPLRFCSSLQRLTCRNLPRLRTIEPLRSLDQLRELVSDFHPAIAMEMLADSAKRRRDVACISENGVKWLNEASSLETELDASLEKFTETLCFSFSLLVESGLTRQLEDLLDRHPEFTAAPWKAWFGETFKESGFDLYRQRVERVPVSKMLPGAIGGACATLPIEEHAQWSRQWLVCLEKERLADARSLLFVAPEVCLGYAKAGERAALARWLERFTDPSDPGVLDPVHAALAKFQMAGDDLAAAEIHVHAIQSPATRDPILSELVMRLAESDDDLASASLLLIEDQALRLALAKNLAAKASASEVLTHRCVVAAGESPQALADVIAALPPSSRSQLVIQISEKLQTDRKSMLLKIAEELEGQARLLRAKASSESDPA